MISDEEIQLNYPKIYPLLATFIKHECLEVYSTSSLIYFLDSYSLFIGITCDEYGEDWIVELNGIIIETKDNRIEAEDFALLEAFLILERTI